jgi:hypothetical protein
VRATTVIDVTVVGLPEPPIAGEILQTITD